MGDQDIRKALKRHEAFWRGAGSTPLVSLAEHHPLEDRGGIPLANGSRSQEGQLIEPDLIDPSLFYVDRSPPSDPIRGDFLVSEGPPGLCWTEAALGCPIRIVTGGPWADRIPGDGSPSEFEPDNCWLEKLDAFMRVLNERSAGCYPITQPLFRGPIDMMASALGHEEACVMLLDAPAVSDTILAACGDLFIEMAQRRLAKTPHFHEGYLSSFGIWAPGTVVRTQADNATMLSPATYRDHVLPQDRRIMEQFEYSLIHLHSGCLHIVEDLLQVDALKCIQVSIDYPGGPLAAEVIDVFRRILDVKPLIITGPVYPHERDELLDLKHSGGLCLQLNVIDGQ